MDRSRIKTKMNESFLKGIQRKATKSVVLLYSAGIDSTVAGLLLQQQGYEVYPLFIVYGQSAWEAEKYLAERACTQLHFKPCKIIKTDLMKQLGEENKLLGGTAVDDSESWVAGRNTLFMVVGGIYAMRVNADGIAIGYMLDDNFVFGDNDYFHHKQVEAVLTKSFLRPMEVFLPTMTFTKVELIAILKERGLVDLTVSCWNAKVEEGVILTCGYCANCKERNAIDAGI